MERYVHIRHNPVLTYVQHRGGATVRMVGYPGDSHIEIQVAVCSQNDQFCRRTGRTEAQLKNSRKVPLEHLPKVLQRIARKIVTSRKGMSNGAKNWLRAGRDLEHIQTRDMFGLTMAEVELWQRDFSFVLKYWKETTPKEDLQEVLKEEADKLQAEAVPTASLGDLLRKKIEGDKRARGGDNRMVIIC